MWTLVNKGLMGLKAKGLRVKKITLINAKIKRRQQPRIFNLFSFCFYCIFRRSTLDFQYHFQNCIFEYFVTLDAINT